MDNAESRPYELVVVGAGILGLATAREFLRRRPGARLAILEKESRIASHQTGRNSGVIHSGIYYAPGSLKARLCTEGARLLMDFCDEHDIPFQRCGKLVVATRPNELARLEQLHQRGVANGVAGLELIDEQRIREIEPHATGLRALYSPNSSIVDYTQVAAALAAGVRAQGGVVLTGARVTSISRRASSVVMRSARGEIETAMLISCAGAYSDQVARMTGESSEPRIVPFRGSYLKLKAKRQTLVRGLIYPVPDPDLPFLGIHVTKRLDGEVWLGPNALLALSREHYRSSPVRGAEILQLLAWSGFWRMGARYWRTALHELRGELSRRAFVNQVERFLPDIRLEDVTQGPDGIRAQAVSNQGRLIDDFVLGRSERVLHVRNAPSPAATSSLALARLIVQEGTTGAAA